MGQKRVLVSILFLLLFYQAFTNSGKFEKVKHIVIIGVDGMSPDGIEGAVTRNLDRMMAKGAFSYTAQAVLPTSSSVNWASMIMGAPPPMHGVNSNIWEPEDAKNESFCGNPKGEIWPTIFRVVRENMPDTAIACFHHWSGFGRLVESNVCTRNKNVTGDRRTAALAARYIKSHTPLLTFIHLDNVDQAGHRYGYTAEKYYKAVSKVDWLIGKIIARLKEAGIYENTIILVISDHGGKDKQHGGNSPEETTIPWIVSGPHVRMGTRISQNIHIYDTAVTVAYILGVQPPDCWVGKPISSAFKP